MIAQLLISAMAFCIITAAAILPIALERRDDD